MQRTLVEVHCLVGNQVSSKLRSVSKGIVAGAQIVEYLPQWTCRLTEQGHDREGTQAAEGRASLGAKTHILCSIDTTNDQGPPQIGPFEQLDIIRLCGRSLHVDDSSHHGNGLSGIQTRLSA